MLESDTVPPERIRMDCVECCADTKHHSQGVEMRRKEGNVIRVVVMRCRLCWNEVVVPLYLLREGELTQLVVRR